MSYSSQPNIPTLSPVDIFTNDEEPFRDKMNKVYTDIVNITTDKKRKEQYLQQEDITIDSYADGKAIFRQTYPVPALVAGPNNINHGITIDSLVDIWGSVSNGTTRVPLPFVDPVAVNQIGVSVTATQIVLNVGAGFGAGFTGFITMYYTKV